MTRSIPTETASLDSAALPRAHNLEQLWSRYVDGTGGAKGFARVRKYAHTKRLARLLHSHLVRTISDIEVVRRDQVDDALTACGLLEVAAMCGVIDPTLGDRSREVSEFLNEPATRRYYEVFYPQLLPTLLRLRLGRKPVTNPIVTESSLRWFSTLLEYDFLLVDKEVEMFLDVADDKSFEWEGGEWVNLDLFVETVADPARLAHYLGDRRLRKHPVGIIIRGFLKFLGYSEKLHRLIERMDGSPELQSAFWHLAGYWFGLVGGQLHGVLATAIESFREHVAAPATLKLETGKRESFDSALTETLELMTRSQWSLRAMTSTLYAAPLESAYFRREQPWAGRTSLEDVIFTATELMQTRGFAAAEEGGD